MRIIERAVDIQAPPAAVWQFLTDTDRYEDWNPFMPRLSGRLAAGERLTLTVRPGKRAMTFRRDLPAEGSDRHRAGATPQPARAPAPARWFVRFGW